jgi:hypothetical protein
MDDEQIRKLFQPLANKLWEGESFPSITRLLAHYTSVGVLESIVRNSEVWFSHPLLMNDSQEVLFGINTGQYLFETSTEIESACRTPLRFDILRQGFNSYRHLFLTEHLLDTYVFCLSEHQEEDTDGLLSMWRGYGGNGSGVAIVFDTSRLSQQENSPLIIAKVRYGTEEQRTKWLQSGISKVAEVLCQTSIPEDKLAFVAFMCFEYLKVFALFTKHKGFEEEKEWRVVYMRDRDKDEVFDVMLSYFIGTRGIEPKLKLRIEQVPGVNLGVTLSRIVQRIILGPSLSSPLAHLAVFKMLDTFQSGITDRTIVSTIPFRPG